MHIRIRSLVAVLSGSLCLAMSVRVVPPSPAKYWSAWEGTIPNGEALQPVAGRSEFFLFQGRAPFPSENAVHRGSYRTYFRLDSDHSAFEPWEGAGGGSVGACADLDSDGHDDWVQAGVTSFHEINRPAFGLRVIFGGDGDGNLLSASLPLRELSNPLVRIGDLVGDSALDIVVIDSVDAGGAFIAENLGGRAFRLKPLELPKPTKFTPISFHGAAILENGRMLLDMGDGTLRELRLVHGTPENRESWQVSARIVSTAHLHEVVQEHSGQNLLGELSQPSGGRSDLTFRSAALHGLWERFAEGSLELVHGSREFVGDFLLAAAHSIDLNSEVAGIECVFVFVPAWNRGQTPAAVLALVSQDRRVAFLEIEGNSSLCYSVMFDLDQDGVQELVLVGDSLYSESEEREMVCVEIADFAVDAFE